jgi:hypothetical protein
LADGDEDRFPALSDWLIDALQTGRTMILRFDMAAELPNRSGSFDGEATVDVQESACDSHRPVMQRVRLAGTSWGNYLCAH